jgi:DNA-binding transcriptional ArsR family regulator
MKNDMPSALLRLQQDVFSRQQAREAGLTGKMIDARLRSGTWRVVRRSVYTTAAGDVGRPGMLWVAVLSAGRGAVLSHESAAENLRIGGRPSDDIHVTVPASRKVEGVPGVHIHRSRRAFELSLADCSLPCTSAEETVLDLVDASETFDDMCGWVTRALTRNRTMAVKLAATMSRRGRLRWRPVLGDMIDATITGDHSVLEHRYERDVERAHGLPEAALQVPFTTAGGVRVRRDRLYTGYRVVLNSTASCITRPRASGTTRTGITQLSRPAMNRSDTAGSTSLSRHARRPSRSLGCSAPMAGWGGRTHAPRVAQSGMRPWPPRLGPWTAGQLGGSPGYAGSLTSNIAIWLNSYMVDSESSVFRALADPTRRQILQDIGDGELSAGEIAARFPIKGPSVSRHLSILKSAGLLAERRDGNRIMYSVAEDRLAVSVADFLCRVCPGAVIMRHAREARVVRDTAADGR